MPPIRHKPNMYADIHPEHRGPHGIPHLSYLAALARRTGLPEREEKILILRGKGWDVEQEREHYDTTTYDIQQRHKAATTRLRATTLVHALRIGIESGLIKISAIDEPWDNFDIAALTPPDIRAIDVTSRGYISREAGPMLGITPTSLRQKLTRAHDRANTPSLDAAVTACYALGVFTVGEAAYTAPLPGLEPPLAQAVISPPTSA